MRAEPIERQEFRDLMRNVPGAVSIIATGAAGGRRGLTASAVCSLTDLPPTILVCINRSTGAHDEIMQNRYFSVNALSACQEPLARVFSGHTSAIGEGRFDEGDWTTGVTGAPVLASAACVLECCLTEFHPASSHTVFFGQVVSGSARTEARPLVYHRGSYVGLTAQP